MVLPDAVDAEIRAGIALALEAGLFQKLDRGDVGGDAGGLQPVQPQEVERDRNEAGRTA